LGFSSSLVVGKDLASPRLYHFLIQDLFVGASGGIFASGNASIQGYRSASSFQDVTLFLGATVAAKTHPSGAAAVNFSGTFGFNWNPGAQLFLDSPNLLRGIPAYALSGNRRVIINVEDRFDNNLEFWHFKTGSAFFVDGGMIWSQGDRSSAARFYKSAGYGIRIMNDKLIGPGVLRIDFAYSFDRRDVELIFTARQSFSIFGWVDTASPVSF
jgi:outer membrane protein assembly factor BamA